MLRLCRQCWDLTTGDNPCRCGELAPVLSVGGASEAIRALADLRELLWPGGQLGAEWAPGLINTIAVRLAFLRPVPPAKARPVLRSVPR